MSVAIGKKESLRRRIAKANRAKNIAKESADALNARACKAESKLEAAEAVLRRYLDDYVYVAIPPANFKREYAAREYFQRKRK